MAHINYPAKVLFKSANPGKHPAPRPRSRIPHRTHTSWLHGLPAPALSPPLTPLPSPSIPPSLHTLLPVITMLIGLVWFRKSYPVRDYIVVALLVLGLYVFMNGDAKASPKGSYLLTYLPRPVFEPSVDPCIHPFSKPCHSFVRALSTCPFTFTSPRHPAATPLSPTRHRVRHLPRDAVHVRVGRGAHGAGALHAQVQRVHRGAALPLLPGQVCSLSCPVQPTQ